MKPSSNGCADAFTLRTRIRASHSAGPALSAGRGGNIHESSTVKTTVRLLSQWLRRRAWRRHLLARGRPTTPNQVLEWNQIFIDTLIATNTANSSSQRLGAIVHTAIFDAYNGIERRYTPIFVDGSAPPGASRRAAVIAAAYTALVGLFPSLSPHNGRRSTPAMRRRSRR